MTILKRFEVRYHNTYPPHGIVTYINPDNPLFTAYVIPRNLLGEAKQLPGINNKGIYFLISEDPEPSMYIGETWKGIIRLDDHDRKKPFWNKAILFLSENFSLDTIKALEVYALKRAEETYQYKILNDVKPQYPINQHDLQFIKRKYVEIEFLLDAIVHKLRPQATMHTTKMSLHGSEVFKTSRRGIIALGEYVNATKFLLLSGSQIDPNTPITGDTKANTKRQELLENKNIIQEPDGKYILQISLEFPKPSPAAAFALGGSVNGWDEWKNRDGKTLNDLIRKTQKET